MKQILTRPIPLFKTGIKNSLLIKLALIAFMVSTLQVNATDLNSKSDKILQQISITGTVKDQDGTAMPGVNIVVEGTTQGGMSDANGNFTISVPNANAVLVFSFVGYQDMKVQVAGKTKIDVIMVSSTLNLEEVVVVGYGTQKKKDITSAIAVVDVKQMAKSPVANLTTALQGVTPGVEVQGNQGTPGSMPTVRIRGVGSVNSTDPLYVVDGVPADIATINPSDVESMQVLKDAASCAIYGSRGANGVIIITTKSGKSGAPKVSYRGYYGFEKAWKTIDVLNVKQWADLVYEANTAGGTTAPPLALEIRNNPNGPWADWDGKSTDWLGALFQKGAIYENSFDISGGTNNGNYFFSAGQYKQDGIIITTPYKRYTVRMNSNWQAKKFRFGENITFNYSKNRVEGSNGGRDPLEESIKITQNITIYNPNVLGGYSGYDASLVGHDASNPIGSLVRNSNFNFNKRFVADVYGEYQIFKSLIFRSTFGVNSTEFQNRNLVLKTDMTPKNFANTTLNESSTWSYNWIAENMLTYHKMFGDHDLTVMADYTTEYYFNHSMSAGGTTLQTETNDILSKLESGFTVGGGESETSRISYLGRLMYSYKGKYLLTANIRRDGSSKFGSGNKWGNFPSASLAWRISDESFMKGISALNNLKLRTSYGVVGNDYPIGPYSYISGLSSGLDYDFAQNGTRYTGVSVNGFNNASLKWETVKQFDIGVDIGLFKGALEATIDYFDKRTIDMLIPVPLPASSGNSGSITKNLGSILNRGFEFSATVHKNISGFDFSVTGNVTTLHNEVLDMGGFPITSGSVEPGSATRTDKGHPIGSFYGYQMLGVFPDQPSIDAYTFNGTKIQPNAKPGDIKWADLKSDGVIDQNDRYYMGSPIPTLTYGVNANLAYKGFDLSLFFQGVSGNKIFAELVAWTQGMQNNFNAGVDALKRWTLTNTVTDVPRAVRNDPNGNITKVSDRYIKNGAYSRLKNASLGYTLPRSVTDLLKISNVRIYVTGRNLVTFTKYPFFDPEIGSNALGTGGSVNLSRGIDNGYYPQARTMIMGIQIDF
jgi:TonB-linked SusC/RagA family outer membrane protein